MSKPVDPTSVPGADLVFTYNGPIYVCPAGRGICLTDDPSWPQIDDHLPEGHYLAEIVIRRQPKNQPAG